MSQAALVFPICPAIPQVQDVPRWDAQRRELVYRGHVVKRFAQWAGNQERILAAFEEKGWPSIIFDPLPRTPGVSGECLDGRHSDTSVAPDRHQ